MLLFILVLLFMLALLDKILRLDRQEFYEFQMKFKLDDLERELRLKVINGEQPNNEWYVYLRKTIHQTTHYLSFIRLGIFPIIVAAQRFDEEWLAMQAEFARALKYNENDALIDIYERYLTILDSLIHHRNGFLWGYFASLTEPDHEINAFERKLLTVLTPIYNNFTDITCTHLLRA